MREKTGAERAHHMLKDTGYLHGPADHPDEPEDEQLIRRMVKKTALKGKEQKRAFGGHVLGEAPTHRPDRQARGGTKPKAPKTINIMIGQGNGDEKAKQAAKAGMRMGMMMAGRTAAQRPAPPMMPPRPPMPGGAPLTGAPGPMGQRPGAPPPLGVKRGGTVHEPKRQTGGVAPMPQAAQVPQVTPQQRLAMQEMMERRQQMGQPMARPPVAGGGMTAKHGGTVKVRAHERRAAGGHLG